MDKNSILGLLLIGGILIGWLVMSQPSKEELALQQRAADSLVNYEQAQKTLAEAAAKTALTKTVQATAAIPDSLMNSDSVKAIIKKQAFGAFAQAAAGTNKLITLENDVLKMNLSSKGGRVASVELKNYKTLTIL